MFLVAAKVGGIHVNEVAPAEFMYINLVIETNVIQSTYKNYVKKLLFMENGCIHFRIVSQLIRCDYFLTAPQENVDETSGNG